MLIGSKKLFLTISIPSTTYLTQRYGLRRVKTMISTITNKKNIS